MFRKLAGERVQVGFEKTGRNAQYSVGWQLSLRLLLLFLMITAFCGGGCSTIKQGVHRIDSGIRDILQLPPRNLYIPKDLDDCHAALDSMLDQEWIEEYRNLPEDHTVREHFGLGLWMRNYWLSPGSRLLAYFVSLGARHHDDMSSIILTSYWRYLNDAPFDLEGQLNEYKIYWEKSRLWYGTPWRDEKGMIKVVENPPFHDPQEVLYIIPLDYQPDTCIYFHASQGLDEEYWIDGLKIRFDGEVAGEPRRFQKIDCLVVPFNLSSIRIDE